MRYDSMRSAALLRYVATMGAPTSDDDAYAVYAMCHERIMLSGC